MHIHLPKPLHGWREFAGEVGIIVLGVLIALTAEQVVAAIHERSEVEQLRSAFRAELADDRARWEEMRAGDPCTARRLDAIQHWLETAPTGAHLRDAFGPMLWNMHSAAWSIAKSSAAAEHIPIRERLLYASLYDAIDNWRDYLSEERVNDVQLRALLAAADLPENRRQVATRIDIARNFLERRQRNYTYFFTRLDKLRIKSDPSQMTIAHDPQALCKPLQSVG